VTFTFELLELELHVRPFEKLVRTVIQDSTIRTVRNRKGASKGADLAALFGQLDNVEDMQRYKSTQETLMPFVPKKTPA